MRDEPAPMRDDDQSTMRDDRTMAADGSGDEARPMHEPATEYEQGRVDEAREREGRFNRSPESETSEDPTRSRQA